MLKSSNCFILIRKYIKSTGLFWFAWATMKLQPKYFQSLLFSTRQICMTIHSCLQTWPRLNRLDTSCWLNNWDLKELKKKLVLSFRDSIVTRSKSERQQTEKQNSGSGSLEVMDWDTTSSFHQATVDPDYVCGPQVIQTISDYLFLNIIY